MTSRFTKTIVILALLMAFGTGMAVAQDKGLVYYLSPNQFDEMQTAATEMIKDAVVGAGYRFRTVSAGNEDVSLQLNQMDTAISQKPVAIIIAAVDGIAISSGVEKAREAGIKVISFDRVISETQVDFHSAAGCKLIGVNAAKEIVKLLEQKNGAVTGRILDIMGDPSDSYTTLIEEGFREVMADYPDVIIDTKIAQGWEASNAADIADNYLVAHPDTDLIFPHSDHMTAATASILQNRGYKQGEVILVSTAGMPAGLQLIREGWSACLVEEPIGAMADAVAMFLDDIVAGNQIPVGEYDISGIKSELLVMPYGLELRIPGSVINIDNIDDPQWWGNVAGE